MMFGFQVRNRQNVAASPRAPNDPASPSTAAIGEIDTKAPFESVKAAVNLFGEASPRALHKKTITIEESVLGKETQLHWILKELDKLKEVVKTAESTKIQALEELENANKTLQELTNKLEAVSESKQAAIEATEAARTRAQQLEELESCKTQPPDGAWQEALDNERQQYKTAANELILCKQQLNNLKQDFDTALKAKLASFQRAADAQHSAKVNHEKMNELSKDVDNLSQTLERVRHASAKAEQDHLKLMEEKQLLLESKKKAKEDIELKIQCLRKEAEDPGNIEKRLEETTEAVNVLQEQLKEVRFADMELLQNANSELDEAKRRLEEMEQEETSLNDVVESLKQQLVDLRMDISVAKENESKIEKLQAELDQIKITVEQVITEQTGATNDVKELELKLHEIWLEAEKARQEEEEMKRQVQTCWREAQCAELAIIDAEKKLEIARREVEEAKAAEELANDQMRKRSSCKKELDDNMIMLTIEEFEALSRKAEEARTAADIKVATIMAQVETIKEKERETLEKLEKSMEESKEIEAKISEANKTAEVTDAERKTVETELNKYRGGGTKG